MGWQDDARRTVVSDKIFLESMEGYAIKVRKYSIQGRDEIDAAIREMQKGFDRKALFEVARRVKGMNPEKLASMTNDDIMETLSADEFAALTEANTAESAKVVELKIRYGLDSHNFCDGDPDTRWTEKDIKGFANQIIEYPEVAGEILAHVEEFNRPLAPKTSKMSGMSPSGSTREESSNGETNSPTEETPQD